MKIKSDFEGAVWVTVNGNHVALRAGDDVPHGVSIAVELVEPPEEKPKTRRSRRVDDV